VTWLHNSGWAPRTTIVQAAQPQHEVSSRVLLQLEKSFNTSAEGILSRLGVANRQKRRAAPAQLRELLNEHALRLPYPPAAIVSDQTTGSEYEETDLLTVCAVLSKSSRCRICATKSRT
jgi:hypothetical protein